MSKKSWQSEAAKKAWKRHRFEWGEAEREVKRRRILQRYGYEIIAFEKGKPDVIAYKNGKLAFIEIKTGKDRLDKAQEKVLSKLKNLGYETKLLVYNKEKKSFNFQDFTPSKPAKEEAQ